MSTPLKPRINRGVDTATSTTLTKRAEAVGAAAPTSPIYLNNPTCKAAIDDYVASGPVVVTAEQKVAQIEQQLSQARNSRDAAQQACAASYSAACTQVEKHAVSPSDITTCGFVALDIVKQGLTLPSAILATYDHATGNILIHVQYAGTTKRARKCIVELSPTPVGPTTYVRLDGYGAKRTVPGYAPGTYEVHAATANAQGRSDWFGPVAVIVK